jgi:hypothetical protein
MKKLIFLASIFVLLAFITSCNKESNELQEVQLLDNVIETTKKAASATDISQLPVDVQAHIENLLSIMKNESSSADSRSSNSNEDVIERATGDDVGHSTVKRKNNGIRINWNSSGHIPGDAVTLWIVIAGYDENCEPFFVDALWGGGKVINNGGIFNINTFLANGDNSNSILELFCAPSPGPGMENAYDFVIHLLSRNHGPYIEGSDQLTTFNDCNPVDSEFCDAPITGDGSCYDYQDSIHYPDCS